MRLVAGPFKRKQEASESLVEAAIREIQEETGLKSSVFSSGWKYRLSFST